MSGPAKSSPKDAQVMSAILKDMGVLESEPRLINQMLEFTYRYVTDVLEDAKVYSSHANRKNIDADDIKLAVQMKMDHSFTTPPPKDLLMEIARQKNSQPLPLVKPYCGPRLPPDRYCLSAPNYRLKTMKKPRSVQYGLPMSQRIGISPQVKSLGTPTLAVVTKTLTQPTVAILNKQPGTPKPTVRVNPGLGGIGASGLTRIISANSSSGASSSSGISSQPLTLSSSATLSSATPSLVVTPNPLKRKMEDDDYDNV
ncbi:transcription initiation factor TFIID subunit 9 isoform X2 [Aplysia californica]|uniref:Transcription initiation factor TFIID subunit 9 isoform X2 n=1 Tax=Aplysia californica TaxID=6500 RepID=A0ABM0K6U1_APLCA|nr:transcription initiation factor TFIID subunit 9 isoform X2 [Aplysia californica]